MHPAFETSTTATAVPITFATKSTWKAISATLPAPARQFAEANAFAAKPGQYLALPEADGTLAHVLFGLEDQSKEWRGSVQTRAVAWPVAGRRLPLRERTARHPPRRAGLRARKLSLQPLSQW